MREFHTMPITLTGSDPEKKREEIRSYFHKTYDLFEALFDAFSDDEVFYLQSEPTRHPMIFYFGHTAAFFINKLILGKVISERINGAYESMFAVGVDEMVWDDLEGSHYEWPSVKDARAYRDAVRTLVDGLITTLPLSLPIRQQDPFWIVLMGIEHERIHIETSSVLHRQLPIEKVRQDSRFERCREYGEAPQNDLVAIKGGRVVLGKSKDHPLYGWDNEYGHAEHEVHAFHASKYLVSNGEFMAFVHDGGYSTPEFWDEEGLKFLEIRGAKHPVFWVPQTDGTYRYRALNEEMPMPLDWPVDVNALEAQAFCRWKSRKEERAYRLPSEAEWYLLYERAGIKDVPGFDDNSANINLRHYASSCPVDRFVFGDLYDVVGNVWQWTQSHMDGFEGFEPHPAYDDFSTPTFDTRHNLIKGGSWISTGNEIMKHSRYAFRRHFYQHAGFRYVTGEGAPVEKEQNIYESDRLISQYCEFQYGTERHFGIRNFAAHCAELAIAYAKEGPMGHALDLGCATGRASFELARMFDHVTGIDFSARFIQVGVTMKEQGRVRYLRTEEGDIVSQQEHTLKEFGLDGECGRVEFWQGDACNLKPHFKGYDLVMATNLIDRLYDPRLFLQSVHERINPHGLLILTSPYTWMEEYTEKSKWIGGYVDKEGNEVSTLKGLKEVLGAHFELVDTRDVAFVIRETPRKFQHTVSQMSVWKKR